MALLRGLIVLVALSWLAGCGRNLMFFPMEQWVQNPARLGLAYEDVVLIHGDGLRLHGWWLPAQGDAKGTVYFLHGNAQNVSTHIMSVHWLPEAGFNVFLLDYRGYGLSDGEASMPEVLEDVQLGLDWLRNSGRVGDKPLLVFGQSLGAALSTVVMAREANRELYDCLLIEASFSGYRKIASDIMKQSWLVSPFRVLVLPAMPKGIDPLEHVGEIAAPTLVLHSKEDEVIPFDHGLALFEAATGPKEFQALLGPHIASLRSEEVRRRWLQFAYAQCGVTDNLPVGEFRLQQDTTIKF